MVGLLCSTDFRTAVFYVQVVIFYYRRIQFVICRDGGTVTEKWQISQVLSGVLDL